MSAARVLRGSALKASASAPQQVLRAPLCTPAPGRVARTAKGLPLSI